MDNPRAFPVVIPDEADDIMSGVSVNLGMTLRDWFAGQALAGLIASEKHDDLEDEATLAGYAYAQADAMLAQRKKGEPR